jgi:hypothetical protein
LNKSNDNSSDNEFYFAGEKFNDTSKTYDEKENDDEPAEDTDDKTMIS